MIDFTPEQLAGWCAGRWQGHPARPCCGVENDTRSLRPGVLYVALRGRHFDGHQFVAEAFSRGACAALVDARFAAQSSADWPGPLLVVSDTSSALVEIAAGHRARLKTEILGITGSLGKTTVKEMTADILSRAGPTARSPESWNNDVGVPLSLLKTDSSDVFGVFEVGMNHPGELESLCSLLHPHWAILTRIGPVHTQFFESEEAIAREKRTILHSLTPDGVSVLARDEPWFDVLSKAVPGRLVTVAFEVEADYTARPLASGGIEVREPGGGWHTYSRMPPGADGGRNALRAIAVGREHGIDPAGIAQTLARFRPLPMRGEVTILRGVEWVNDAYNANPISMAAALASFATRPARRRWLVLGAMRELADSDREHLKLGRLAAGGSWAGLLVVGEAAAAVAEGARRAGFPKQRIERCRDVAAAAARLLRRLRPGDAVLLKGSRSEAIERVQTIWMTGGEGGRTE